MPRHTTDIHRVRLLHRSSLEGGYRDLGVVDVTLAKGYLVDQAGEITFVQDEKIARAGVDKVARVDGHLTVHATKL